MKKKNIGAWLVVLLLVTQFANAFGFTSQANAESTEITEALITSVSLDVYTDDTYTETVTGSVYQLDSYSELNYTWSLPDGHGYKNGSTYRFNLPAQFELYNDLNGELDFDGDTVATYTVDKNTNEVVFTFKNYIESHDGVGGTFKVKSLLSSKKIKGSTKHLLEFPIKGGTQIIELDFKPNVSSTVEKKGEAKPQFYNPESIAWTVDVNKALDSVTNAVVTDKLPSGLSLDPGSISVHELEVDVDGTVKLGNSISSSQYIVTGSTPEELKLSFVSSPITKAYRIEFSSTITGTGVDATSFVNEAVFTGDNGISKRAEATVTVGRGKALEKTSTGYDAEEQIISWAINYNYNEKTILAADAELKDSFNKSQDLIISTVKVYPVTIDGSGKGVKGTELTSDKYDVVTTSTATTNGFELKFNNDIDSAYRIEYQTKANGRVFADGSITNSVTYDGKTEEATRDIKQLILHKGYGNVNYLNKTVDWTIKINEDSKKMNDLNVTDTFGNAGLKLVPGTLKITPKSGGTPTVHTVVYKESTPVAVTDGFVIIFDAPITEPYTITYTTSFDYDSLAVGKDRFSNTAALQWLEDGDITLKEKEATAVFDPRAEVKNNGLKFGSYNAVNKEITWTVGANYNRETLNAAELVDTITDGQIVNKDSVKVNKLEYSANGDPSPAANVSTNDYEVTLNGDKLKVTFNKKINYAFYVTFKTTFADQAIDANKINNTAVLYDGLNPESKDLKASVNIPQGGEYVSKSGAQDGNKINWTIYINRNQSFVKAAEITDIPSDNQILLSNTFHLYKTTVATNGEMTPTNEELIKDTDYKLEITTDNEGRESFKLSFLKDIAQAYVLKYQSLITAKNNDKVSNKVSFSGKNVKEITSESDEEITVKLSSGSGTGSGIRGPLTVTKVEEGKTSKLLAGAVFGLYRIVDEESIWIKNGTTNEQGVIEFTKLTGGKYVLIEKTAPAGYVLDTTPRSVEINSTTGFSLQVANKVTATPSPSVSPSPSPSPTASPVVPTTSPSTAPTATPTTVPTATPTTVPTATPTTVPATETPTVPVNPTVPTPTPSSVPGVIVSPTPTVVPTTVPTATPSVTPAQPAVTSTPVVPQATPQTTPPAQQETTTEEIPIEGEVPLGGIIVTDEDGNEEEVLIEIDVEELPKGTVTELSEPSGNHGGKTGILPQTGEESPLPLYLLGGGLVILGLVLTRRFKQANKGE